MKIKIIGSISGNKLEKFIRGIVDKRLNYYNVQFEHLRKKVIRLEELEKVRTSKIRNINSNKR